LQLGILRRIDDVDAAGEDCDRATFKRCDMGRGVDAAREARSDDEAFEPELGRKQAGEFLADGRAVAGVDHGHDRAHGEFEPALDVEEGRRGVDLGRAGSQARRWR
jgi:hypothetical protein